MEQNDKYEERVRQRAEEMARAWEKEYIKHKDAEHSEQLIIEHMPAARLAVQWEAEAHEQGFRTGVRFVNTRVSKMRADDLFEKGLISDDERRRCLNEPRLEQSVPSPNQPEQ